MLRNNIISNYIGQIWRALMGVVFIPFYVKYLGVEAYGLIGVLALLQAWMALLDMGLKGALVREMARFGGGKHSTQSICDLLRSVEVIGAVIAVIVMLCFFSFSDLCARQWLTLEKLSAEEVALSFTVMGGVTSLRLFEGIYISCMIGLQRHLMKNIVLCLMVTIRGLGALAVLAWISPTIEAFFLWQGVVSIISVGLLFFIVHSALPVPGRPPRFSWAKIFEIRSFAGGIILITFLTLVLIQVDKVLIASLLSLENFAYYALATTVSNVLIMMVAPVCTSFYPIFTEQAANRNENALRHAYHQSSQLLSILMGTASITLMVFCDRILLLWMADPALVSKVAPLAAVITLGTLLNGMMAIPYHMQLAHGWTWLTIRLNCAGILVFIPAIMVIVPKFGPLGAAWLWVALNVVSLVFYIHFMHRRLLVHEKWRWCFQDVTIPLIFSMVTSLLCRGLLPDHFGRVGELLMLISSSSSALLVAALVTPVGRSLIANFFRSGSRIHF